MMMKRNFFLAIVLLLSNYVYCQVGIGTNQIENDLLLKVSSTNKGVLIPNLTIPNLNQSLPVASPAYGLLAYNNYSGKLGFNYWDGTKWSTLIDTNNVYPLLGVTISFSTSNSSPVSVTTPQGALNYLQNSTSGTVWTEVPGCSKDITISQLDNSVLVITEGMVQANNAVASLTENFTYAIGIFVDGKLAGVRNYSAKYINTYSYDFFSINTLLQNLSLGNHTIKTYVTLRYNLYTGATSWKFGGSNNTNSVNADMSKINMFIKLTEKSTL